MKQLNLFIKGFESDFENFSGFLIKMGLKKKKLVVILFSTKVIK